MVVFSVPEDASFNGRVIYKFTSPVDKGYIGKSVAFKSRVSGHRTAAYAKKDGDWVKKTKWKEAIRDFGWDNLRVEILERVPEEVSLEDRERYWIARLNTVFPNGYNMNEGGGGVIKHTEEAKAKISAKAMGNTNKPTKPVTSREILESYDDGTQKVKFVSYASAMEAERKTGVNQSHIAKCCNEKNNSAGGFFWHFTKEDDLVGERKVPSIVNVPKICLRRAVFSTSPGGKKQRHEGGRAAGRTLSKSTGKKFSSGHISECCNGNATHHHGYSFRFESDEAENNKNIKKRKRN